MYSYSEEELSSARGPIESLISKSLKSQQKLVAGGWQHRMLGDNIAALKVATTLMYGETEVIKLVVKEDLERSLITLISMIDRTANTQTKFLPGTSQYTLQKNRLLALKIAESVIWSVMNA